MRPGTSFFESGTDDRHFTPETDRKEPFLSLSTAIPSALLVVAFAVGPVAADRTIPAELGKSFRLKKGEVARFADGRATLRIVHFVNSPCPKGAQCIWSGQAVVHELTVDGKVVAAGAGDAPYDVVVEESDYRTWARFLVDSPEASCSRLEPIQRGACLRSLARRRSDPALCRSIGDERTRGFCLEDLAEELRRDELCRDVASPSQHCLYVKSKEAGDLAACAGVVTWKARVRCFKELSRDGGGGPRSCSDLPAELAKTCREIASGPAD